MEELVLAINSIFSPLTLSSCHFLIQYSLILSHCFLYLIRIPAASILLLNFFPLCWRPFFVASPVFERLAFFCLLLLFLRCLLVYEIYLTFLIENAVLAVVVKME